MLTSKTQRNQTNWIITKASFTTKKHLSSSYIKTKDFFLQLKSPSGMPQSKFVSSLSWLPFRRSNAPTAQRLGTARASTNWESRLTAAELTRRTGLWVGSQTAQEKGANKALKPQTCEKRHPTLWSLTTPTFLQQVTHELLPF